MREQFAYEERLKVDHKKLLNDVQEVVERTIAGHYWSFLGTRINKYVIEEAKMGNAALTQNYQSGKVFDARYNIAWNAAWYISECAQEVTSRKG